MPLAPRPLSRHAGRWAPPLLLALLWGTVIAFANPTGDFPLNDDWSYAEAVRALVEESAFRLTGWTAMPLVAHVGWGALFTLPAGFSHTALRFSTLLLGLVGIWGTFALLRSTGVGRPIAFLGALTLALNPIYVNLAHTFMTDVPFVAATVWALVAFTHHLRAGGRLALGAGSALSVAATLIRQLGLAIPLGYAVLLLVRDGRRALPAASLAVLPSFAALVVFSVGMRLSGGMPALYNAPMDTLVETVTSGGLSLARGVGWRSFVALVYTGFFVLPLLPLFVGRLRHLRRGPLLAAAVVGVAGCSVMGLEGRLMPFSGNVLHTAGLGPLTLRDVYELDLPNVAEFPYAFRVAATLGAIGGGAALAGLLAARTGDTFRALRERRAGPRGLALAVALFYLPLLLIGGYFDRYLLPLLPVLLVVMPSRVPHRPRRPFVASAMLLGMWGAFSTAGTHDYLAWNRARWDALSALTAEGVAPNAIDGGFEFNGWYGYDPDYTPRPPTSWYWVRDDTYVIAFGPIPGYTPVTARPLDRWLPAGPERILTLRRSDE